MAEKLARVGLEVKDKSSRFQGKESPVLRLLHKQGTCERDTNNFLADLLANVADVAFAERAEDFLYAFSLMGLEPTIIGSLAVLMSILSSWLF
jgi:hypothetical protein